MLALRRASGLALLLWRLKYYKFDLSIYRVILDTELKMSLDLEWNDKNLFNVSVTDKETPLKNMIVHLN